MAIKSSQTLVTEALNEIKTITADIKADDLKSNYGKVRKAAQHLGSSEGEGATFKLQLDANN